MANIEGLQQTPTDQALITNIIDRLKKDGLFDKFRRDCLADVDTKPAYQNLKHRVEGAVSRFLSTQTWHPGMNKNQLREQLRRHITESQMLVNGVDRVVDQVVNPKIYKDFKSDIDAVICEFLGIDPQERERKLGLLEKMRREQQEEQLKSPLGNPGMQSPPGNFQSPFVPFSSPGTASYTQSPIGPGFGGIPSLLDMTVPPPSIQGLPGTSMASTMMTGVTATQSNMGTAVSSLQNLFPNVNFPPPMFGMPPPGIPGYNFTGLQQGNVSSMANMSQIPPSYPGLPQTNQPFQENTIVTESFSNQSNLSFGLPASYTTPSFTPQTDVSTDIPEKVEKEHKEKKAKKKNKDLEPLTVESLLNIPLPKQTPPTSPKHSQKEKAETTEEIVQEEVVEEGGDTIVLIDNSEEEVVEDDRAEASETKDYAFSWEHKEDDKISNVTVSSVHTSDLSSFEEENLSDISDLSDFKDEEGDGDRDESAYDVSVSESGSPVKQPFVSTEAADEQVKPRRLLSLIYNPSDSDDEESREQKKERMAKEKEVRYIQRQQRRAELDAKRKDRELERTRKKEENIKEEESPQKGAEQSAEEESPKTEPSPKKSPDKRKTKQQLKQEYREQKVAEKRMALRRQRQVNRKYISEDFESIFSANKQFLSQDVVEEVVETVVHQTVELDESGNMVTADDTSEPVHVESVETSESKGSMGHISPKPCRMTRSKARLSRDSGERPGSPYSDISNDSKSDLSLMRGKSEKDAHVAQRYDLSDLYKPHTKSNRAQRYLSRASPERGTAKSRGRSRYSSGNSSRSRSSKSRSISRSKSRSRSRSRDSSRSRPRHRSPESRSRSRSYSRSSYSSSRSRSRRRSSSSKSRSRSRSPSPISIRSDSRSRSLSGSRSNSLTGTRTNPSERVQPMAVSPVPEPQKPEEEATDQSAEDRYGRSKTPVDRINFGEAAKRAKKKFLEAVDFGEAERRSIVDFVEPRGLSHRGMPMGIRSPFNRSPRGRGSQRGVFSPRGHPPVPSPDSSHRMGPSHFSPPHRQWTRDSPRSMPLDKLREPPREAGPLSYGSRSPPPLPARAIPRSASPVYEDFGDSPIDDFRDSSPDLPEYDPTAPMSSGPSSSSLPKSDSYSPRGSQSPSSHSGQNYAGQRQRQRPLSPGERTPTPPPSASRWGRPRDRSSVEASHSPSGMGQNWDPGARSPGERSPTPPGQRWDPGERSPGEVSPSPPPVERRPWPESSRSGPGSMSGESSRGGHTPLPRSMKRKAHATCTDRRFSERQPSGSLNRMTRSTKKKTEEADAPIAKRLRR